MRILVCVKQVPDLEADFIPNAFQSGYDEAGLTFRMNNYDEFAVEEAVRIKEEASGVEITALSVGPARAEQTVRRAMEMGADYGVLIEDADAGMRQPVAVAGLIAAYAKDKNFDLILTGVMAEDDQCSQVGPMLAEMLDMPCASTVVARQLADDLGRVTVERELEGGARHIVRLPLPAVLTIQSGINFPRYPSLSNKLRVRKQEVIRISAADLDVNDNGSGQVFVSEPPPAPTGEFLDGTTEEIADQLVERLYKLGVI